MIKTHHQQNFENKNYRTLLKNKIIFEGRTFADGKYHLIAAGLSKEVLSPPTYCVFLSKRILNVTMIVVLFVLEEAKKSSVVDG